MKLHILLKPNASRNAMLLNEQQEWVVRIAAPPVEGKANAALLLYMAEVLDLPRTKIKLLKGQTSRYKTLEIEADEQFVTLRLNAQLIR